MLNYNFHRDFVMYARTVNLTLILLLTSGLCSLASAAVYKRTDENGKVHYSDQPFEQEDNTEIELNYAKANQQEANRLRAQTKKIKNNASQYSAGSNHQAGGSNDESEKDQKRCDEYTARYQKYLSEGVVGINPITGQTAMMQGEGKQQAIDNARDNAEIFCN